MQVQAIIVGAGSGSRLGAGLAKQFRFLGVKRVGQYTVDCFRHFAPEAKLWVVVSKDYYELACELWGAIPQVRLIIGGAERFFSVKLAVEQIENDGLVFVHDMVRPCVSLALLNRCYLTAKQYGVAIPMLHPVESVRYQGRLLDRMQLGLMQTPQTFRVDWLKRAFCQPYSAKFTDEASVVEQAGYPLHFVLGERQNIKITYLEER